MDSGNSFFNIFYNSYNMSGVQHAADQTSDEVSISSIIDSYAEKIKQGEELQIALNKQILASLKDAKNLPKLTPEQKAEVFKFMSEFDQMIQSKPEATSPFSSQTPLAEEASTLPQLFVKPQAQAPEVAPKPEIPMPTKPDLPQVVSSKPEPAQASQSKPETTQISQPKPPQAPQSKPDIATNQQPAKLQLPKPPQINKPPVPPKIDAEVKKITDAQIIYILNKLKIPVTQQNIQIARVMLGFGIMIQQELMAKFWQTLAQLQSPPEHSQVNVYSACFLEKSQLPVTPKNINTMTNFIVNKPQLADQLAQVQQGFQLVMAQVGIRNVPEIMRAFSQMPNIINEMILQPQVQNQQKMIESLLKIAQQAGVEKELPANLAKQVDFEKLAQVISQIANKFQGTAAEKALLIKTADLFSQVSQNLSAQQLINQAAIQRSDLTYFYWQLPVKWDGNYYPAELRLSYQPYQLRVDPENVRVDFKIKTKNLGELHFALDISNNIVRGKILVEDDNAKYIVGSSLDKFKKELVKLFYQIHFIDCMVQEPPPILWDLGFDRIDTNRVNLRA